MAEQPKEIYAQMAAILANIKGVEKALVKDGLKYPYRSIDGVYNEVHSIFGTHKVFIAPEIVEKEYSEAKTKEGHSLTVCHLTVKFTFYATDGSNVVITMPGEGIDSFDKATNKALSGALKYALLQAFLIPTGEDTDHEGITKEKFAPNATTAKKTTKADALKEQKSPASPPPGPTKIPDDYIPEYPDDIDIDDMEPPVPATPHDISKYKEKKENSETFVLVPGVIQSETQKAICFAPADSGKSAWFPKSSIQATATGEGNGLWVKKWIFEKKIEELT